MKFKETKLKGAFEIELEKLVDDRGFFARAWCQDEFAEHGLNTNVSQANISYNKRKNTLRGLHRQVPPFDESKLVRCARGSIFDVIVDLRFGSPTYCEWFGVELSANNGKMLYMPEGFAHGFQTLEDEVELFYMHSGMYSPKADGSVRWDDPEFSIEWPEADERIISEKDQRLPFYVRKT